MRLILVCAILLCPVLEVEAQKNCRKGIPCGNTCIAANKTCRVGTSRPTPPAATAAAPATQQGRGSVAEGEARFVASIRGSTFYAKGCPGARKLSPANLRYFRSEEEAQQAGYTRSRQKGC